MLHSREISGHDYSVEPSVSITIVSLLLGQFSRMNACDLQE